MLIAPMKHKKYRLKKNSLLIEQIIIIFLPLLIHTQINMVPLCPKLYLKLHPSTHPFPLPIRAAYEGSLPH